jgi:hypothetical protein
LLSIFNFLLFSCVSNPYHQVDDAVYRADYEDGALLIEKDKKKIYRDPILYYLDKGMLTHYAEEYRDSVQLLQNGERAIEDAFTKSITMEIGSYLLNDKTKEYDGEDYEDIYINAFNALNYYHQNNIEDALVEIRRMNNKLRFLASKYDMITTNLQQTALKNNTAIPPNPSVSSKFSDSALARYLGMLFYRGIGQYDEARIDSNQLKVAFANTPEVYSYRLPASIDEELYIPEGKARLNVIGFCGLSPIKEEEAIRVLIPGPRYIKIALPVMVYRPSAISRIEVVLDNGYSFNLELLEDIEAVAKETFKEKVNVIYLKSVLRATVKGLTSSVLGVASDLADDQTASLVLGILSLGAQAFAEASEQADLRISRYFPGKAYVGGITLDPGTYSFNINYYTVHGRLVTSFRRENIQVRENTLNLVEAICLK